MTVSTTSYDVRAQLEDMLERDLLGPWDGPAEELPPGTTPGERYLLGKLVPRRTTGDEPVSDADEPRTTTMSRTAPSLSRRRRWVSTATTWRGRQRLPPCAAARWQRLPSASGSRYPRTSIGFW